MIRSRGPYMRNRIAENDTQALHLLLEKVYRDGGYNFRDYKHGTVTRRLQRRLYATGTWTYGEYIQFLDTHPEEYQRLADTLTIKVSGFFRSPYAFQQVGRLVLPGIMSEKGKRGQHNLSVWSTACAQGEEPYSIAILLSEFLGHRLQILNTEIYATDISMVALTEAQAGIYKNIGDLSDTVLERYFTRSDEGHVVNADIRQMVNFSHFDLVSTETPPFTNLDCVFCCNILIYLQKQLQEKVLGMLYDSLATPGYLILGEVETPPDSLRGKLECLDTKAKIYKKTRRSNHV